MSNSWKLLVAGALESGRQTFDVINPATEQVFAQAPKADTEMLETAISAAQAALPAWRATSPEERQRLFQKLAQRVEENAGEYVSILMQEAGKPRKQADIEVRTALYMINTLAGLSDFPNEAMQLSDGRRARILRRPYGVVAGITPWNMPLLQPVTKLMQALATGNCLVLKVAPTAPLAALKLGADLLDIFPAGTVSILTDENDLGPILTSHPGIAKVAFTGSTETGRRIMGSAAPTLKRLTMELGGSDAAIVLEDVDVALVAKQLYLGAMYNCGQICTAPKRFYVAGAIYDQFCDALVAMTAKASLGDPADPATNLGPLQNRMQYERVLGLIDDAKSNGVVCAGGIAPDRPGYFVEPTIVRDVEDGTRVVDEEQFGPIMPVVRIKDEQDGISRANRSLYGLGGSVWCADEERGAKIAAQLECGSAWINEHNAVSMEAPYSGAKQSGYGVEGGNETIHSFTQVSVVYTKN
ncbi:MAG: aldehyde dehydrogenase family protein [Hyphomonas sp.]